MLKGNQGTNLVRNQCCQEDVFAGQCNVAPLVPSWFKGEGRGKQTVHITAALSGIKFCLMPLKSIVRHCLSEILSHVHINRCIQCFVILICEELLGFTACW